MNNIMTYEVRLCVTDGAVFTWYLHSDIHQVMKWIMATPQYQKIRKLEITIRADIDFVDYLKEQPHE